MLKSGEFFGELGITLPYYLVGDSYYAAKPVIGPLIAAGQHLVSEVRSNAMAYSVPEEPAVRRRGRPRKYGRKIALKSLFAELDRFVTATSPVYGERDVTMLMRVSNLAGKGKLGFGSRLIRAPFGQAGKRLTKKTNGIH